MDRLARSMERLLNSRRTSATACTYVPLPYVSGVQARSGRPREPPTPAHIGRVLSKICIPALEPQEAPSLLLLHAM